MATRASKKLQNALIQTFICASGQVCTTGRAVQFASADDEVQIADGANDAHFGIALNDAVAGESVQVALLGCAVIPVKVGTGGATRGAQAVLAADGYTNQTVGGGTTLKHIGGIFVQSGVAGDLVGLLVTGAYDTVSA